MRKIRLVLPLLFAVILSGAAIAASTVTMVMPGQEKYMPQPGNYSMAVLYGNPSKPGFYVIRLKFGPNFTFPPHWHPGRENVTVVSGMFYAGIGAKIDKAKAMAFAPGSFISIPGHTPHFAFTKSQGAVVDVSGMEPMQNNMIK
jgi:quercetin dioxygenase-like cupin family protein